MSKKKLLLYLIFTNVLLLLYYGYRHTSNMSDPKYFLTKLHNCNHAKVNKTACYKSVITSFARTLPLKTTLDYMYANPHDQILVRDCHELSHMLGETEFRRSHNVWSALARCTDYCFSGCYHGAVSAYFKTMYRDKELTTEAISISIDQTCQNQTKQFCQENLANIEHGLGHALMELNGRNLQKSLTLCGNREWCYYGAFMEDAYIEHPDAPGIRELRKENPVYPCNLVGTRYQQTCYTILSTENGGDIPANIHVCNQFPEQYQELCFVNVAKKIATSTRDIPTLVSACEHMITLQQQKWCIQGIVYDLQGKYPQDVEIVSNFCASHPLALRKHCLTEACNFTDNKAVNREVWQRFCTR